MNTVIRSFIAIETPFEIQKNLDQAGARLRARGAGAVRWVAPRNIHLTLKFLGDATSQQIGGLKLALSEVAREIPAFDLRVGGVGAFPNQHHPRVIWIGLDQPKILFDLQKSVDIKTRALGFPGEERPFSAHLTLGRVSQNASSSDLAAISAALGDVKADDLGTIRVAELVLFRSDLQPTGPVYTALNKVELSGKNS